jgi:hypothetical protein
VAFAGALGAAECRGSQFGAQLLDELQVRVAVGRGHHTLFGLMTTN